MRTLAFDGRMGASGDMILGALLSAGADPDVLSPVADGLDIGYDIGTTTRGGIEASSVTVRRSGAEGGDEGEGHHHTDEEHEEHDDRDHTHDHHTHDGHDHGHGDDHGDHTHAGIEGTGPHRTLPEVREVLAGLDVPAAVEREATAIFELLAEAEATVHGTAVEETHFHEVGADDAIADVVGAALLLAELDPERVVTTPLATGGGSVETSHGVYPVPVPAVVELAAAADWSLQGGPVDGELLTPTGAAILAHVAEGVDSLPALSVAAGGYGAGSRTYPEHPNVLRAVLGESTEALHRESITVLETNLDDATPETLGGLQETLRDVGALDVTVLATTGKKSRPGHLVRVVVRPEDARAVARELAAQTGTLGVREHGAGHRFAAEREQTTVPVDIDGQHHDVTVKLGRMGGDLFDVSAEFDDALAVARATGLPIREVARRAEAVARERLAGESEETER